MQDSECSGFSCVAIQWDWIGGCVTIQWDWIGGCVTIQNLYCDSGLGMLARRQALRARLGAQAGALACAGVGGQARVLGRAGERQLGAQAWAQWVRRRAELAAECGARGRRAGGRRASGRRASGRPAGGRRARRATGRRWASGARAAWPWAVHSVHSSCFWPGSTRYFPQSNFLDIIREPGS